MSPDLPAVALGRPSPGQDAQILNYALLLKELQTAFYDEAVAGGGWEPVPPRGAQPGLRSAPAMPGTRSSSCEPNVIRSSTRRPNRPASPATE